MSEKLQEGSQFLHAVIQHGSVLTVFHCQYSTTEAWKLVEGSWNWGEQTLPRLSQYTYLGVEWDEHVKRVLQNGRKK